MTSKVSGYLVVQLYCTPREADAVRAADSTYNADSDEIAEVQWGSYAGVCSLDRNP
ncbi:hypothetical protein [Nocardia sp. NPDC052316]|uniref:hypothetical protein n=1 Tax=Nocardia sp. NPDC052316 TaxID=3364329 RepID=UPI0037C79AE8